MGAWNDFSNWASSTAAAVEKDIGNFATGVADNMKFGLTTVVGAPVTIVREIKDGVVEVSKVGGDAFKAGAHEGGGRFRQRLHGVHECNSRGKSRRSGPREGCRRGRFIYRQLAGLAAPPHSLAWPS